jgi:hypothetical protein
METPAGVLRISMPRHGSTLHASRDTHTVEELGFSCTLIHGRSSYIIEARFLRDLSYSSRPSMYAQLNVFTTVDDSYDEPYTVVMRRGTIADVETALRTGVISPFHNNYDGYNLCLRVSFHQDPFPYMSGLT